MQAYESRSRLYVGFVRELDRTYVTLRKAVAAWLDPMTMMRAWMTPRAAFNPWLAAALPPAEPERQLPRA